MASLGDLDEDSKNGTIVRMPIVDVTDHGWSVRGTVGKWEETEGAGRQLWPRDLSWGAWGWLLRWGTSSLQGLRRSQVAGPLGAVSDEWYFLINLI